MLWLIQQEKLDEIRACAQAGVRASEEQQKAWATSVEARAGSDGPRNLTKAGDVAEIRIEGVLVPKMDFIMWLFGMDQTAYSDIVAALSAADSDPEVKSIVMYVDSPGGRVDGLFDTLAAIQATKKPISVVAACACSGAYALAAVAGPIRAKNAASQFGSIGVAAQFRVSDEVVDITSTEAPNKRPDPTTESGKAVIREYLDQVHDLFVDAIATARGTDKDNVNSTYGRGATLLAGEAKKRGMVDSIPKPTLRAVKASAEAIDPTAQDGGAQQMEKQNMDLETLRAQHPDVFKAASAEGEAKERKRVCGHLKMADSTGATKVAFEAIREGKSLFDEDVHADYMSHALAKKDQDNRQSDSDGAGNVTGGVNKTESQSGKDLGDLVVERLAAMSGQGKVVA